MQQMTMLAAAILLAMGLSAAPALAGNAMNPCNPCAAKQQDEPVQSVCNEKDGQSMFDEEDESM